MDGLEEEQQLLENAVRIAVTGSSADAESFVQQCSHESRSGRTLLCRVVILASFLQRSQGQHEAIILPALVKLVVAVREQCSASQHADPSLDALAGQALSSLSQVLHLGALSAKAQGALAAAGQELVCAVMATAAGLHGQAKAHPQGLPASLMRALTQEVPSPPGPCLPLLAPHTLRTLQWAQQQLLDSSQPPRALYQHSQVTQLLTTLVWHLTASCRVQGEGGGGVGGQEVRVLLLRLARWAAGVVEAAAQSIVPDAKLKLGGGPHPLLPTPSGPATHAATQLLTATLQALLPPACWPHPPGPWQPAAASSTAPDGPGRDTHSQPGSSKPNGIAAGAEEGGSAAATKPLAALAEGVAGLLLDLGQACLEGAAAQAHQPPAADAIQTSGGSLQEKVLSTAGLLLVGLGALLCIALRLGCPAAALLPRLKSLMLAAAALAPRSITSPPRTHHTTHPLPKAKTSPQSGSEPPTSGAEGDAPSHMCPVYSWDVSQSLQVAAGRLEARPCAPGLKLGGWRAAQLAVMLCEELCEGLAEAWRLGQRSLVQALLLLPSSAGGAPNEVKVTLLSGGRLLVLVHGDPDLARSWLPLLAEVLLSPCEDPDGPDGCKTSPGAVPLDVAACCVDMVAVLAGEVGRCLPAAHISLWVYGQALDLLTRLYRDCCLPATAPPSPSPPPTLLPHVAHALAHLGSQLAAHPPTPALLPQLRLRLLTLSLELAMLLPSHPAPGPLAPGRGPAPHTAHNPQLQGSGAAAWGSPALAVGSLLPAIAAVSSGLMRGLGQGQGQGGGGGVVGQGQEQQEVEHGLVQVLRAFWLHVSLLQLGGPSAPLAWRQALAPIAAASPVLLLGLGAGSDVEVAEQLQVTGRREGQGHASRAPG